MSTPCWAVFTTHPELNEIRISEVRRGHDAKERALADREELLEFHRHLNPSETFVATVVVANQPSTGG